MSKRNYNNEPRIIKLKFNSKCRETGEILPKGTNALYYPDDKFVYSLESKQAEDWRNFKYDEEVLNPSYNFSECYY